MTNHDSVNQMIADLAEVDFLEVCTQAGFMESSATPKFSEKLFICELILSSFILCKLSYPFCFMIVNYISVFFFFQEVSLSLGCHFSYLYHISQSIPFNIIDDRLSIAEIGLVSHQRIYK